MPRRSDLHLTEERARIPTALLSCAAFVSGFSITALEISLGRVLAPFFGAGLAVWALIIASVIIAISIGYLAGGYYADGKARPHASYVLISKGATLTVAVGFGIPMLLRALSSRVHLAGPWYWTSLTLSLLVFSIPCFVFAMLPPLLLRLGFRERDSLGRQAGALYATGSFGSVFGVLIPGLWWVPFLGLKATFCLIASLGLLLSIAGLLALGRISLWTLAGAVALFLAVLQPQLYPTSDIKGVSVLYDGESAFQHIRVLGHDSGKNTLRYLQLNEGRFAHSILSKPHYVTGSVLDQMALLAAFAPAGAEARRILIVGLAAGTVSNIISRVLAPTLGPFEITGIEIDSRVVQVAEEYFELDKTFLQIQIADGRTWLNGTVDMYDLIILDAYRQPSIPAHLATGEFFQTIRTHLATNGIACLNLTGHADGQLVATLTETWRGAFPNAEVVVRPGAQGITSQLLVGTKSHSVSSSLLSQVVSVPPVLGRALGELRSWIRPVPQNGNLSKWTDNTVSVELLADLESGK